MFERVHRLKTNQKNEENENMIDFSSLIMDVKLMTSQKRLF
jgi:hypothetical protein